MSRENLILLFALAALTAHQIWIAQRIDAISQGLHVLGTKPAEIVQAANGNTVTIQNGQSLPDGPKTVEQVAAFLGVKPDTVRDAYIPRWIEAGHMSEADKAANRWRIPQGFEPYKP